VGSTKSGCWLVALPEFSDGYSFTVEELEGTPPDATGRWPKVRGPRTFEFEVPESELPDR